MGDQPAVQGPRVHAAQGDPRSTDLGVREADKHLAVVGGHLDGVDVAHDVDVPGDVVPAHLVADAQRALNVDAVTDVQRARRRARQRLGHAHERHMDKLYTG